MDFLNHRKGAMIFYQISSFLPHSVINLNVEIYKRLREFEKIRKRLCEFDEIEI
jgi:hypothetical protein